MAFGTVQSSQTLLRNATAPAAILFSLLAGEKATRLSRGGWDTLHSCQEWADLNVGSTTTSSSSGSGSLLTVVTDVVSPLEFARYTCSVDWTLVAFLAGTNFARPSQSIDKLSR